MDTRDHRRSVDSLGEALHFLRMCGAFYCRSELTAPWGLDLPPMADCVWFHVVTAGACWLEVAGSEARRLQPGDLALVPHGQGHCLRGEPGAATPSIHALPHEYVSEQYAILRHGGGGVATSLVCGAVRFAHPAAHNLVALLPSLIAVEGSGSLEMDWLQSTLRLMAAEARAMRPGGETVITRLCDILVIQAIRSWIEHDPAAGTGWLGALQDEQIGRALSLMHREPARDWTLASLADAVAMSRSAFSARFSELVNEPAMQYLTRWRMQVAVHQLQVEGVGVAEVGRRLGYQSEAAFSRAFKRIMGVPPSAMRGSDRLRGVDRAAVEVA